MGRFQPGATSLEAARYTSTFHSMPVVRSVSMKSSNDDAFSENIGSVTEGDVCGSMLTTSPNPYWAAIDASATVDLPLKLPISTVTPPGGAAAASRPSARNSSSPIKPGTPLARCQASCITVSKISGSAIEDHDFTPTL